MAAKVAAGRSLDLRHEGIPVYLQLAGLFRRRIERGEWPVGRKIPTLDELALEFGVARATVRQATGLLKQEGLLARYRGRGTFVLHRPQPDFSSELEADWESVIRAYRREGFTTEILASESDRTPPVVPRHAVLAPSYHHVRRLNCLAGAPYALDEAYLDSRLFARPDAKAVRDFPALLLLHEMLGDEIANVIQTVTIAVADVEVASLLRLPLNAPVAVIDRTLHDADHTVICTYQGIHRGDRFRLKMQLR